MAKEAYVPPPDPDFERLAHKGYKAWERDQPSYIAFDSETSGFRWGTDRAFCFQLGWLRANGDVEAHYFEIDRIDTRELLRRMLKDAILIGHNTKFDLHRAIQEGILKRDEVTATRIHDTEALAHLDDEHRPKGLKDLAISVLGYDDIIEVPHSTQKGVMRKVSKEKYELDSVRRKLKLKKEDGYHLLPRAVLVPYAIKDAQFTIQLYARLWPKLSVHEDLMQLYAQEMRMTMVFLDMEANGMAVDMKYVQEQLKVYQHKILEQELEIERIVNKPVGKGKEEFNPNSNPQIREFFESVGIESPKFDKEVLKDLDHPLAPALLQLRKVHKIRDTYFLGIQRGERNGVFHPSFRQHGTVTGRTSSGTEKGDS